LNNNITRDLLLRYPTFDEINQYIKLNLADNNNNNLFNSTFNSRPIRGLNARIYDTNSITGEEHSPKKLLTIIFNEESVKFIDSNEAKQNFLTILFNSTAHTKIRKLIYSQESICSVHIHSPQSALLTIDYSNKQRDIYIDLNRENTSLIVHKTVQLNLGYPYGDCIHYKSNTSPFNSISQSHCLRKCSQLYFENMYRCSPLIINGLISDLDKESNKMEYCPRNINDSYHKLINEKEMMNKCQQLCPEDCISINFKVINKIEDSFDSYRHIFTKVNENTIRIKLLWNTRAPMLYYIETPVMSFVEFLCYCGGIFGLWFATDGKLFTHFIPDSLRDKFDNFRFFHNYN
jgi:hypothetical protein